MITTVKALNIAITSQIYLFLIFSFSFLFQSWGHLRSAPLASVRDTAQ